MTLGSVVMVTAIGFFAVAPLVLAWVSTDPARWGRVEGVLGRELPAGVLSPRWVVGLWVGFGAAYAAVGITQARTDEADGFPWLSLLLGAACMSTGVFNYVVYRRRCKAEESAQAQVEDRAEPSGPAASG